MNKYLAEVCFGDKNNLREATVQYNRKANEFQSALQLMERKYSDLLQQHQITLGVETIDNFDSCTIILKPLPAKLPEHIQTEVVALFNTTWSQ